MRRCRLTFTATVSAVALRCRLHRPRRDPARASAARCSTTPRAASRSCRRGRCEACHRAGVEVVIMSGRRETQVRADARLIGQTLLHLRGRLRRGDRRRADACLTGDWLPDDDGTPAEQIDRRRGSRTCSSSAFRRPARVASPRGTASASSRTCCAARSTSTRRTTCSAAHGHDDLRFLDNGAIARPMEGIEGRTHAYHLVPGRRQQGEGSRLPHARPRLRARRVHRESATRSRTSTSPSVGRAASSWSPTAPSATPACATAIWRAPQRDGHRGPHRRRLLRGGRLNPGGASLTHPRRHRSLESAVG